MRRQQNSYDANGNLTYEATARKKADGHYEPVAMERKLLWDEENRLRAISENGYVSTYVYDADGERTVKMHGGGQHSFRNGTETSLHSDRATYTLYPNAFLTYDEDGQYVKHIYMGGERIVSKIVHPLTFITHSPKAAVRADFGGYMPLSRYKAKKRMMEAAINSSYQALGVPYLGVDRDSTSYPPNQLRMDNTSMKEDLIFFYHKDHLGSSNAILDSVGNILQWIEYLPYGEVMVDEQHSADYATPYKFNGKELDEETGLLYYGARYFDPKKVNWLSTDRFSQFYPHMNPYSYCGGNPILAIDYGGDSIVYVNDNHRYVFDVRQGTFGFYDSNGQLYNDDNSDEITSSLLMLLGKPRGGKLVNSLMKTKKRDVIISIFNEDDAETLSMRNGPIVVKWNPRYENFAFNERGDKKAPSFIALAHELLHSEELIFGNPNWHVWYYTDKAPIPLEEMRASMEENIIRAEHFIPQRTNYSLKEFGRFTKSAIPYLPTILPLSIR